MYVQIPGTARPQRVVKEAEDPPPAHAPKPPEPTAPRLPPEPRTPHKPPRAVAKPAAQDSKQPAAAAQAPRPVTQQSHNRIDDEIDEIEYPKADDDYERILVR